MMSPRVWNGRQSRMLRRPNKTQQDSRHVTMHAHSFDEDKRDVEWTSRLALRLALSLQARLHRLADSMSSITQASMIYEKRSGPVGAHFLRPVLHDLARQSIAVCYPSSFIVASGKTLQALALPV